MYKLNEGKSISIPEKVRVKDIQRYESLLLLMCDSSSFYYIDLKTGVCSPLLISTHSTFVDYYLFNEWLIAATEDSLIFVGFSVSFEMKVYKLDQKELFCTIQVNDSSSIQLVRMINYNIVCVFRDSYISVFDISGDIIGVYDGIHVPVVGIYPCMNGMGVIDSSGTVTEISLESEAQDILSVYRHFSIGSSCLSSYCINDKVFLSCVDATDSNRILEFDINSTVISTVIPALSAPGICLSLFVGFLCVLTSTHRIQLWNISDKCMVVDQEENDSISSLFAIEDCVITGSTSGMVRFLVPSEDISSHSSIGNSMSPSPSWALESTPTTQSMSLDKSHLHIVDTEEGRLVEGEHVGRRELHYSHQLQSLKRFPFARTMTLVPKSAHYSLKQPRLSIEEQNMEEYLLSNRMLEGALFNRHDIAIYEQIRSVQKKSDHKEEKMSDSLRQRLQKATGSIVIDDAEHALMNSPAATLRLPQSDIPDLSLSSPSPVCSVFHQSFIHRAAGDEVVMKEKRARAALRKRLPTESPLLSSLFAEGVDINPLPQQVEDSQSVKYIPKTEHIETTTSCPDPSEVLSDEDLVLYDVTNDYSLDEIALLREKTKKQMKTKVVDKVPIVHGKESKRSRELGSDRAPISPPPQLIYRSSTPTPSQQRPHPTILPSQSVHNSQVRDPTRYTLTLRRQEVLRKLFLNTLRDGKDYQYLQNMIRKLGDETSNEIRLPVFRNTPENLRKLRVYLQSLDLTFEQIDTILGDDTDLIVCY